MLISNLSGSHVVQQKSLACVRFVCLRSHFIVGPRDGADVTHCFAATVSDTSAERDAG